MTFMYSLNHVINMQRQRGLESSMRRNASPRGGLGRSETNGRAREINAEESIVVEIKAFGASWRSAFCACVVWRLALALALQWEASF